MREDLKTKSIPYAEAPKTDSTHILVKGVPLARVQDVQALAREQFSDWNVSQAVDSATQTATLNLALKVSEAVAMRTRTLEQARETIVRRIDALGIIEPVVADYGKPEDYELVVELPGVDDPGRVRDIIQSAALLELKIVQDGPFPSKEATLAAHGGVLPPDTELVQAEHGGEGSEPPWYILNRIAAITGRDLTGAQQGTDENGRPDVLFNLNRDGAARFGQVTGQNIGRLLAIVLDNRVVDAPVIHGRITVG